MAAVRHIFSPLLVCQALLAVSDWTFLYQYLLAVSMEELAFLLGWKISLNSVSR